MLGVLAGLLRSLWATITLQAGGQRVLFAPVASRPAPGASAEVSLSGVSQRRSGSPGVSLVPACLLALALYLLMVTLLHAGDLLLRDPSWSGWVLRSTVFAGLAGWLAARWYAAKTFSHDAPGLDCDLSGPAYGNARGGFVSHGVRLHAAGLLWASLALADLHLFSVVHPVGVEVGYCADMPLLQFLAHDYRTHALLAGPGVVAMLAGWLIHRFDPVQGPPSRGPASHANTSFQTEPLEHASRG